jgi:hypothetical protein
MSERFDVVTFRKTKNDKVFAIRLGSASPRDDGGFSLWLDAMPAPGPSGQYEIVVCKPRDRKSSEDTPF